MTYNLTRKRVWVAGHLGMVGSALVRQLTKLGCDLLTADRTQLDLRCKNDVDLWMRSNRPDAIFVAAATVGGIAANMARPAEFIYDNLSIASNLLESARVQDIEKVMFLGSACVYPRLAEQPIREEALMTGPLEPTNEPYAIAKLAGISLCSAYRKQYGSDFISVIPTNLFGPGDNVDINANHVVPALIAKVSRAKHFGTSVEVWGTGTPRREFLFVDDAADAMIFLMQCYSSSEPINIGSGEQMSIRQLATAIARCIGFEGEFIYDASRPDGMPVKALDASRLSRLGWQPQTTFTKGLALTCEWFRRTHDFDASLMCGENTEGGLGRRNRVAQLDEDRSILEAT